MAVLPARMGVRIDRIPKLNGKFQGAGKRRWISKRLIHDKSKVLETRRRLNEDDRFPKAKRGIHRSK